MKIKKWTLEIDMKIKNWDTEIIMKIALKWNSLFYNAVINPKDADEIASSVDTDQIVLVGLAVITIILQKSLYQIRLKKQSDQGLHWLTYCQHFLDILSGQVVWVYVHVCLPFLQRGTCFITSSLFS